MRTPSVLAIAGPLVASAVLLVDSPTASACGCLSPPAVTEGQFAVNQRAEQIIFEVEPGWVTAHVLIKYAGDPSKFAWIVPVPEVPELAISPLTAFGLLDQMTSPSIDIATENLCPVSEYACEHAQDERCGGFSSAGDDSVDLADAGAFGDAGPGGNPPVTVIDEKVVGDYQTVTFRASEAQAATQWLRDNGFVVNTTTSIYMESYVQANMVFVAAKLVAGAGVSSIKPLKLRYRAAYPQVPLVLTAVAAQPHLTVTSFIYGAKPFKPQGHPLVQIDGDRIARDSNGRSNYPMVLARAVDEAGGDGFVIESRSQSAEPQIGTMSGFCCDNGTDSCNLGNDNQCQCPRAEFDFGDCSKVSDLVDGVKLLDQLAAKYPTVTRITTRVSAEEMTFDPAFEPDFNAPLSGNLSIRASNLSLQSCTNDIIDKEAFVAIKDKQDCSTVYCGAGQCVTTNDGPGCACDAGYVAQRFDDLDGKPSVTCVPQTPPCDLRAGGDPLPDACASASCGAGTCIDRNGIAVCSCDAGAGAVARLDDVPYCSQIRANSNSPGAEDFSEAFKEIQVCAPALPACGDDGWYVKRTSPRPGVACGNTTAPTPLQMVPKSGKKCGFLGCGGCSESPDGAPIGGMVGALWVFLAIVIRRRRARA